VKLGYYLRLFVKFKYLKGINLLMEISKTVLIGIYAIFALYTLYKIFFKKNPYRDEYEKLYNTILNSDKYKVKGQFDKEE